MANAAEAVAAGTNMRRQDRLDSAAQGQIRLSVDAGADLGLAVSAAGAHGRDAVDELGLPDRPHLHRPTGAVHRARLDERGRDDVVAAARVVAQFVEQIAPAGPVPQVMVRINSPPSPPTDFPSWSPRARRPRAPRPPASLRCHAST